VVLESPGKVLDFFPVKEWEPWISVSCDAVFLVCIRNDLYLSLNYRLIMSGIIRYNKLPFALFVCTLNSIDVKTFQKRKFKKKIKYIKTFKKAFIKIE